MGPDGALTGWDAFRLWRVTCEHEPGDTTVAFELADALDAELRALGAVIPGGGQHLGNAATDAIPYARYWGVYSGRAAGAARVTVLDARREPLEILVSLDLLFAEAPAP